MGQWFLPASLSIRTLRSRRTLWQESSCRRIYFPCCRTDPRSQRVRLSHTRRGLRRDTHRESSSARCERGPGLLAASAHPLVLIHPSVPWPLPGHPEAMKMGCPQGYFHTSAWKVNSANFRFTEFYEVGGTRSDRIAT